MFTESSVFSPKAEIVVEVLSSMQMLPLYQFFPAVVVGSHPIQKDKNIREPQGRDSGDEFWLMLLLDFAYISKHKYWPWHRPIVHQFLIGIGLNFKLEGSFLFLRLKSYYRHLILAYPSGRAL